MADSAPTTLPTTYLTPPLYDTIQNKTFLGLVIAEFLAAFNDQCIHASAMFFAIRKEVLDEGTAIALMPLLFYSPWALFATLSGYLADKVSKRTSLIFWKVAEVFITGFALLGFWIGSNPAFEHIVWQLGPWPVTVGQIGPWIVMSCVFLMGTHSTFYVPCKYGVLPELFTVRSLSRANGLVESTTFLAVILGTTVGGVLSKVFREQETSIGVILMILAVIGTGTSYLIRRMPPADPFRQFPGWAPWNLFRPLFHNLAALMSYRLSSIAVLGLAFFVFMVAFMRATMYMFGQSQNPRWDEQETSIMVAVVSLGVGLGSPLAGLLSRGKVELGLVSIGALGMVVAVVLAGLSVFGVPPLIAFLSICLVLIGLFASFYLVPLYSLLQYSAPKGSKGSSVATSNFICTTGAILASAVFFSIGFFAKATGVTQSLETVEVVAGTLEKLDKKDHHVKKVVLKTEQGWPVEIETSYVYISELGPEWDFVWEFSELPNPTIRGNNEIHLLEGVRQGSAVKVCKYRIRDTEYYQLRLADRPLPENFNNELLPRYLFLTSFLMMFGIIVVLCIRQRDMLLRSLIWFRLLGKPALRINGYENLPTKPTIIVTNVKGQTGCLPVVSALVRPLRFVLPAEEARPGPVRRALERYAGMVFFSPDAVDAEMQQASQSATDGLRVGKLVVLSTESTPEQFERLLSGLRDVAVVPVVPVTVHEPGPEGRRITIGPALAEGADQDAIREAVQRQLASEEVLVANR